MTETLFEQIRQLPPAKKGRDGYLACISLWRPWADWVSLCWKQIETRTHKRLYCLDGVRIGIHASLKWDNNAMRAARRFMLPCQIKQMETMSEFDGRSGTILCTAIAQFPRQLGHEHSKFAMIECEGDPIRYGIDLVDVAHSPIAGKVRGGQGIFYVPLPTIVVPTTGGEHVQ